MPPELIRPVRSGNDLRTDIRRAKSNGTTGSFDVWWLGQSGFLIQWNGQCLLVDPYLSDSLTTKYAGTEKPHVRLSELVIQPNMLDCIDIVTSSHNHTDHLDGETLIPLLKVNPRISFLIPEANRDFVAGRVMCSRDFPIGLNDGERVLIKDFAFHGIPAAHNTIERDENGRCRYLGYVIQFGNRTIYHSGDTLWYNGLADRLKPFHVDAAFLPINGNDPARGVAGNMNAEEAARLGRDIRAKYVIPHHYDMFAFNTADPADFARAAVRYDQPHVVLRLGERWTQP